MSSNLFYPKGLQVSIHLGYKSGDCCLISIERLKVFYLR